MTVTSLFQRIAVCLAAVGFCVPQVAWAATPQPGQQPVVIDVQLHEGGVLLGQVVTPENTAAASVDVALRGGGEEVAATKTDKNGYFAFAGLHNGVYQIVTPKGVGAYRVWTELTAPPSAQPGALVINGQGTVRGQYGFWGLFSNPWIVAGIIAAAVAIPVAIHNADRGPGS